MELLRFDLDENEMLTAAELTPGGEDNNGFYFGNAGGMGGPNADMGFLEIKPETVDGVSRQMLAHYDKDKNGKLSPKELGLGQTVVRSARHQPRRSARRQGVLRLLPPRGRPGVDRAIGKLPQEKGGFISDLLRNGFNTPLPAIRAEVFNPNNARHAAGRQGAERRSIRVALSLGDAYIGLSASDQQFSQFPRQFFEQQFREADVGKKGVVDRKRPRPPSSWIKFSS